VKNVDSEVKTIIALTPAITREPAVYPQQPAFSPQHETAYPQELEFYPRQPAFSPQHETAYPQEQPFYPQQPAFSPQQEIDGYRQGPVIYPPATVESTEKTVVELPGLTITERETKVISTPAPSHPAPLSAASPAMPLTPDLPATRRLEPALPEPANSSRFAETKPAYSPVIETKPAYSPIALPEALPTYYNLPYEHIEDTLEPWNGPSPSWTGVYRVQSSSHEKLETAMEAVTKLRRYGIDPKITRAKIRGKTFYRVSFGPWNTRREAALAAEYVKQQPLGYFDAFVQEP
jgi:hypothetical protein